MWRGQLTSLFSAKGFEWVVLPLCFRLGRLGLHVLGDVFALATTRLLGALGNEVPREMLQVRLGLASCRESCVVAQHLKQKRSRPCFA